MTDLLLAALRKAEQEEDARAVVFAKLEQGPWHPARIVKYRLMGFSAKRIAQLAETSTWAIGAVLHERGLL